MAQVFHRSANVLARASIIGGAAAAAVVALLGAAIYRSPAVTQVNIAKAQPIPFSHQRHVGGNGIDCRYCHTSVEESGVANVPPTETCMTCHSQILADAPMLEPVHDSWKSGKPIEWTRVYDLPDFVYFDHSIHVAKGIGCTTCHGNIQDQRLTHKANTLHMAWCLECHRAPEKFIRPKDKVFDVDWKAPENQLEIGKKLVQEYKVKVEQLDNCSVCHR
ncbi:MAG: cytochrome c3 family protein [Candidatus Hydrogenedentes bacterium]|nr:cytochrome c3 family protein [Candidatus Hydrogenedentota bacterium]